MIKLITILIVSMGLMSCASTPTKSSLSKASNYDVCWKVHTAGPHNAGFRVFYGLFSLGLTEIEEANRQEELDAYLEEAQNRNLGSCKAKDIARADCRGIYTDTNTAGYKQCVLSTTYSVEGRISAEEAKIAAEWAEYEASQAAREARRTNYYGY
jgi:hypothetical protein